MDMIFSCPKCEQDLAVDTAGAGTAITCPSCGEAITIPEAGAEGTRTHADSGLVPPAPLAGGNLNPIAASAAAKIEMHLKVPVRDTPADALIAKTSRPLEFAAKETDRKLRVKTIRHQDCIEVGHDRYDEMITEFLQKVGADHLVSITPITYTFLDIGSQKLLTDFGVMILFKG